MPDDLRLPGPLRADVVPMRAALHALLRAQAARVHDVADGHEALESGESLTFQRLDRKKELGLGTPKALEWKLLVIDRKGLLSAFRPKYAVPRGTERFLFLLPKDRKSSFG